MKNPDDLAEDLLADEKHTRFNCQKVYIATTEANDCVLGASVSLDADTECLIEAYGHFKTEANNASHDYGPKTVATGGWTATKLAWQCLFQTIAAILCFLHSFIKIRDRCKQMLGQYEKIKTQVWEIYHSDDKNAFTQRMAGFKEWTIEKMPKGNGLDAVRFPTENATRSMYFALRRYISMHHLRNACLGCRAQYFFVFWILFHSSSHSSGVSPRVFITHLRHYK